jgi:hypothetical protein
MMQHFRFFSIDRDRYPTGCSKLDAFWRCLIENTIFDFDTPGKREITTPAPSSYYAHFMKFMSQAFLRNFGLPFQLTGQEPDLRDLRQDGAYFTLDEMFPEDVQNNISILALIERQPFIKLLYASLWEGDGSLWRHQTHSRDWLNDVDVGRQFFLTRQGFMGVGPPCPAPFQAAETPVGSVSLPEGSGIRERDVVAVLAGSDKSWILRNDGKGGYTIVGQAYVYGLSEGICFDAYDLPRMETLEIR